MNNLGVSPNQIKFQLSGSKQINLTSQLPTIQRSVTINPDNVGGIILDGGGGSGNGITFGETTVQGSTIRGLQIRNFSGNGVVISPTVNEPVIVQNCYIHNNGQAGILITAGANHGVIGQSVIQFNGTYGVSIGTAVQGVQISGVSVQGNYGAGIELAGNSHDVSNCIISSNGMVESTGDNFGGVVFGTGATSAIDCSVHDSTIAANTPYGAKLVVGPGNKLQRNETYLNTTKGYLALTNVPTLSHYVVDTAHDKVIVCATVSGPADEQVTTEFFVRFDNGDIATGEGAVYCGDALVQLNSSGQGNALATFDRQQVFQATVIPGGPFSFPIGNPDRLVATTTSSAGTTEFSALSAETLLGDYNLDGNVDACDYVIWRHNQGATGASYTQGDGDFDGDVDNDDYNVWRSNFGQTP